jgi:hypothetical protein
MSYYYSPNNTLALFFGNTGEIGIGTSNVSPNQIAIDGNINISSNLTLNGSLNVLAGINNPNGSYIANSNNSSILPGFTFSDGSNFGMFRASNNIVGISTNGLERLRINNIGNMGVGTQNPNAMLEVLGNVIFDNYFTLSNNNSNLGNAYFASNMTVLQTFSNFNDASFMSNLSIPGSIQVTQITSNVTFCNTFSNLGNAVFKSNVIINQSLSNFNNASFMSNVIIPGTIIIKQSSSNVTISNSLSNLGNALFQSNVTINNQIYHSNLMTTYVNSDIINGNSYRLRNLDPIMSDCRFSLGNTMTTNNYSSRFACYSLGTIESSSNTERLELGANSNGGFITWNVTGTGTQRNINIFSNSIFTPNGNVIFNNNVTHSNTTSNLGNAYFASNVIVNNNLVIKSINTLTNNYTITLPQNTPSLSNIMLYDTNATAQFSALPITNVYSGTNAVSYNKIWTGTAQTNGGRATFFPTIDGTNATSSVFSTVFMATAIATMNTTSASGVALTGLNSISTDRRTVVFNVVNGTGVILGGNTLAASPNGIVVNAMIIGI